MKALGYIRVSTADQVDEGVSLDVQIAVLKAAAATRGLDLIEIIQDAGISAKSLDRPGITRALEMLRDGEAEVLIVTRLDRFSRSVVDFLNTIDTAEKEGWKLIALDIGIDMTTDAGRLFASIMASVSEFFRRTGATRTREALAELRASGVVLGRPPAIPTEIRERMKRERAEGMTYSAIAQKLTDEGIPTPRGGSGGWSPSTIQYVVN